MRDVRRRVVGAGGAAAEHHVAVRVAAGHDGGGGTVEVDAEKGLRLRRGLDGVDRGLKGAVGAVLEAEGHREARGHLPVGLRLGRAGADGAPADEVGHVLRRDRIEEFRGGGEAEIEHIAQKSTSEAQTGGDIVGAVEVRVHDQALPAHGRAGFLKIDAHDDHHAVGHLAGEEGEALGVVAAGGEVVNRARTDDEEKTLVVGEDQPVDLAPGMGHELGLCGGLGQLGQQGGRGRQGTGLDDIDVGSFLHESPAWRRELAARKPAVTYCR